jgi:hypothetical protein
MRLDYTRKSFQIQALQPLLLEKSLIKPELQLTSVVMRMAVIRSLFGLLVLYRDHVVLFKITSNILKIRASFGAGIQQPG